MRFGGGIWTRWTRWTRAQRQVENRYRSEGVQLLVQLLGALADEVREGGEDGETLRPGLLLAAGYATAVANVIRTGEAEMSLIDVDGWTIPLNLRLDVTD